MTFVLINGLSHGSAAWGDRIGVEGTACGF